MFGSVADLGPSNGHMLPGSHSVQYSDLGTNTSLFSKNYVSDQQMWVWLFYWNPNFDFVMTVFFLFFFFNVKTISVLSVWVLYILVCGWYNMNHLSLGFSRWGG